MLSARSGSLQIKRSHRKQKGRERTMEEILKVSSDREWFRWPTAAHISSNLWQFNHWVKEVPFSVLRDQ
jgi:hypothetical protein